MGRVGECLTLDVSMLHYANFESGKCRNIFITGDNNIVMVWTDAPNFMVGHRYLLSCKVVRHIGSGKRRITVVNALDVGE